MSTTNLRPTGIGMAALGVVMVVGAIVAGGSATAGLLIGGMALLGAGGFMLWLGIGYDEELDGDDRAER